MDVRLCLRLELVCLLLEGRGGGLLLVLVERRPHQELGVRALETMSEAQTKIQISCAKGQISWACPGVGGEGEQMCVTAAPPRTWTRSMLSSML